MGKILIINGADFSENGISYQTLVPALSVANSNAAATLRRTTNQATVLTTKPNLNNTKWGNDSANYPDRAKYELNKIPDGAKMIEAIDTAKQKQVSICLYDADYVCKFIPSWSGEGIYSQRISIESYPGSVYYSLNYQTNPGDIETLKVNFTF